MHHALRFFPRFAYASELLNGNDSIDAAKAKLKALTGMEFDDFMLLDKLNTPSDKLPG